MNILQELYASNYYSTIHYILIVAHVTLALVALIAGPIPMIVRKGGINHQRVGKVYMWSMIISLLLAIALLFFRFNVFLAGITALSLNGVVTGVRALHRKRAQQNNFVWFDTSFAILALLSGVALLVFGILTGIGISSSWIPSGGESAGGGNVVLTILPMIFGFVIVTDAMKDLRSLRVPSTDRNWWWYYHMERMLGSYIALATALAVQQVGPRLPDSVMWISWIAPSAIGSPLIAVWIKNYRKEFSKHQTAQT